MPSASVSVGPIVVGQHRLGSERAFHRLQPFRVPPLREPQRPRREPHLRRGVAVVRVEEPSHGRIDVALVSEVLLDDRSHLAVPKSQRGLDHQSTIVTCVHATQPVRLAGRFEALDRVRPDDLQHGETGVSVQ